MAQQLYVSGSLDNARTDGYRRRHCLRFNISKCLRFDIYQVIPHLICHAAASRWLPNRNGRSLLPLGAGAPAETASRSTAAARLQAWRTLGTMQAAQTAAPPHRLPCRL